MDPIESIKHFVALLFWFVNERHWTIQSTSTILQPRKDAEQYKKGDIVVARFSGKKYRAIIVSVEDEKEKLHEVSVKFDGLLRNASLSSTEVLQYMGIEADLALYTDPASLASPSHTLTKRDGSNTDAPIKPKKTKPAHSSKAKEQKEENLAAQKQKKAAFLESSKQMASRLIEKMVPRAGNESTQQIQPTLQNKTPEDQTQTFTKQAPCSVLKQAATTPTSFSGNYSQIIYSPQQKTLPSLPCSTTMSHVPSLQAPTTAFQSPGHTQVISSPLQQTHQFPHSQQFQSEVMPLSISNSLSCSPYQNTDTGTPYWNTFGNGSASEYLATSFTQDAPSSTVDCSKCMMQIQSLEERVKTLEYQVQSFLSCREPKTPTHSDSYTVQNTPSAHTYPVQEPFFQPLPVPEPETGIIVASNGSLESQTERQVELVPGYGVMVSVPQIDACLRKAKTSGTALTRYLCMVLFEDDQLASSCARGTKTKPALDKYKVDAIITYVGDKRNLSETEVVQAINQKCSDMRKSRLTKPVTKKS